MTQTVFGKPIEGEISHYTEGQAEQYDPELLREALDEAFASGLTAVRWEQYTPYFNDGDPCIFRVGEVRGSFAEADSEGGDYEDGFYDAWSLEYDIEHGYLAITNAKDIAQAIRKVDAAINSHHYVFLNKTFGDPAQVTATPEGFNVEFYDHD